MANGLRCYDQYGRVTLDTGDRITRYVTRYGFSLSHTQQATVTVDGWADDGTWGYYCTNLTYQIERSGGWFRLTGMQNGSYGELVIFRY
ncbi:hypothetical protein GFK26_18560 [Variovorax paradoxus]|uniref:Uncharacterized protein n=1 Tax=Variovorax paradoxus TaxID=34073 RepID=A0A5Q0M4F6_VARPD|nr:hypothetical protein [Variovorax paradoxus]QFZ84630.1 hypothetical protein GFK26_18560 [Variovorax paradoxus]